MSYQFIHVEAYARNKSPQKNKKTSSGSGKRTLREVIAEASREFDACAHVPTPEEPILLFGQALEDVEAEANAYAKASTDSKGRKLRADALVIVAGVISLSSEHKDKWQEYKKDSIEFLKNKYGDDLKSVIEHTDEAHPHIHFYVVPKVGNKIESVHEGLKAKYASKKILEELTKKQKITTDETEKHKIDVEIKKHSNAFKSAMRSFQDDFNNKVAKKYGLSKIGPGVQRLTNAQYKAQKAQLAYIADRTNEKQIAIDKLVLKYEVPVKKALIKKHEKKYNEIVEQKISKFTFFDGVKKYFNKPTKASEAKAYDLEELNQKLQKENEARIKEIADLKNNLEKTKSFSNDILKQSKTENDELKKDLTEVKKLAIEQEKQHKKQLEAIALNLGISVEEVKKLSEIEKIQAQQTRSKSPYKPF